MPLTRANITTASATMIPTYILLSLTFGAYYIADPGHRLALAPSVTFQRQVMPLWVWGTVMLAIAAIMLLAAATYRRILFAYALCCCALTWTIWGAAIGAAIFVTPNTSYLAPVLPWFVAVACIASTRSLIAREH